MKKINIGFEKIECIAHIADVHIRNLRRHKEYKQVFRKLYKDLKDNLSRSTSKLETDAGQQVDKMGQAHGSEMEDMANQIKDMNEQITELEKSDHWSENLW